METLELTLVIKLKNADAGWIEESIREQLEDGEEIVDFYHSTNLEMLASREQLMEDIDCIISSNFDEVEYKDDVIKQLCDAVCKTFPISK